MRFGTNETLMTLMLNYIALYFLYFLGETKADWSPVKALLGTLVFGFFNTLQVYSGSLAYAFPKALVWLTAVPSQLFRALPFIITALVLVFASARKGSSGAPAAIGLNYYREDR